eukprot:TRINITY_DN11905_c0_g1_i10.p1 TRINITY_DN11905_c0_g1~~TRINITY_DN11905_c0_g1_i10.p1  ORF type:complete len:119 (+),score=40.98 TRINITY_DN11905_c0_g1_i10:164-520(+)
MCIRDRYQRRVRGKLNVGKMATTPEEAEAVRAFAICDTNGDQKIDRAQLAFFLRALGQNPTQNEVNELPAEVDFAAAWKYYQEHKKEPLDVSVLEDLFSVWDKDRTCLLYTSPSPRDS